MLRKYLKPADILIFIAVIVIGFTPMLFMKKNLSGEEKTIAVCQNNKLIAQFPLNQGEKSVFYKFSFKKEDKTFAGTLETKNSKVRLLRLPKQAVPKPIHSNMSWIESSDKIIVALPVSLTVSITDTAEKSENKSNDKIDIISY